MSASTRACSRRASKRQFPNLRGFADVADVGQAAKDWPQLNFIIYHSAYRHVGGDPKQALAEFERTGRISWTSDLADIPAQYGVNNVYGDVGQLFATTLVAEPNVCAALMGTLIKGLGVDRVCWGTDALWTGAPQWQIEGLRRLEIPEDMQKKFGFAPLGAADGPVKTAIFGGNNARLYNIQPKRAMLDLKGDRFALMKAEYEKAGPGAVQHPLRLRGADRNRWITACLRRHRDRRHSAAGPKLTRPWQSRDSGFVLRTPRNDEKLTSPPPDRGAPDRPTAPSPAFPPARCPD